MNIDSQKLELIRLILNSAGDTCSLNKIIKVIESEHIKKPGIRKFGCGKKIFTYIADDFNEPLQDFKEYMK